MTHALFSHFYLYALSRFSFFYFFRLVLSLVSEETTEITAGDWRALYVFPSMARPAPLYALFIFLLFFFMALVFFFSIVGQVPATLMLVGIEARCGQMLLCEDT